MSPEPPPTPEPAQRLSPVARWAWRAQWAAASVAALVVGRAVGAPVGGLVEALLWTVPLAALVLGTILVPELRYRRWRWDVREHEIDIRHGVLRIRRTLIPMPRVQHVETTRGVLEQALDLASVRVHTAADSHTIPFLHDSVAARVRDRVAALARTGGE